MNHISNLHQQKIRSIESFIRFSDGLELPHLPLTMYIEISNLCDLQCAMCPTFSALNPDRVGRIRNQKRELIDIKDISKLEPYLVSALQVHAFGDGEPTIHPDFLEILELLKSYEVMVDFFTNGMHLTDRNCRAIVDNHISAITVSFSGVTKEEYENVYINGDFDIVLNGIRRLAAYKRQSGSPYPRIDINSIGFKHHLESLPEFVKLMGEAGVNLIQVKPLQLSGHIPFLDPFVAAYRPGIEGKIIDEALVVAKEIGVKLGVEVFKRHIVDDNADVEDFVMHRRAPDGDSIRNKYANLNVKSIHEFKPLAARLRQNNIAGLVSEGFELKNARTTPLNKPSNPAVPCLEPFKNIYIGVNGDAKPCCFSRGSMLGNVFNDGVNVWKNESFAQCRKGILKNRYPEICDECIREKNAPAKHNINFVVALYSQWFQHVFGIPFDRDTQASATKLPDNNVIIKALSKHCFD